MEVMLRGFCDVGMGARSPSAVRQHACPLTNVSSSALGRPVWRGFHAWRPLRASCRRLLGVFWSSHVCSVNGSGDHCLIAATAPAVTAPETTVIVGSRVRAPAPAGTCRTLATRGIPAHACVVEFISPVPVAFCAAPQLWKGPWSSFRQGSCALL